MEKFQVKKEEDLKGISQKFLEYVEEHKVFAFYGEMGVGKTTFISYLAEALDVEGQISSPTYGYVNEYLSPKYGTIYHFDLYRIASEEEAYDIGIEEYIYGDDIVFIEWAENIENLLPKDYVKVNITKDEHDVREIEVIR